VPLLNTAAGYGALTKLFHWLVVALFAMQVGSGLVMTRLEEGGTAAGLAGDDLYNWHKKIGLLALLAALARIQARRMGELPPWAPTLTETEKRIVHRAEQLLYLAMVLMPVSGFTYVMAGGYGVMLAGVVALPNPIGKWEPLGEVGRVVHVAGAVMLALALAAHLGVVLRHAVLLRDGLLRRMLPGRTG
jgi:cytochrome b561